MPEPVKFSEAIVTQEFPDGDPKKQALRNCTFR